MKLLREEINDVVVMMVETHYSGFVFKGRSNIIREINSTDGKYQHYQVVFIDGNVDLIYRSLTPTLYNVVNNYFEMVSRDRKLGGLLDGC